MMSNVNRRRLLYSWLMPLLVLCCSRGPALAQGATAPDELLLTAEVLAIKPLEEIIVMALEHSPLLKHQSLNVDIAWRELKMMNQEWARYLAGVATVQLGNIQALGNTEGGVNPNFITQNNLFYGAGLQFRLSAHDLLTRKDRLAIQQDKLEQEKLMLQDRELQLRELVIQQYQELKLRAELLELKAQEADFQNTTMTLAEQYFRQGELPLDEYAAANTRRSHAQEALAQARAETLLSFRLLRELVGSDISAKR
jgi:outer membrane protein TolC